MVEDTPAGTSDPEPLFGDLQPGGTVCYARLLYAVLLALARHRRLGLKVAGYAVRLVEVIRLVRYDRRFKALVAEIQATCFQREVRVSIALRLSLSFWAQVLGVSVADLCQALADPNLAPLRHALGLADGETCYPQRVAELHTRLGEEGVAHCHTVMRALLLAQVPVERLTEADVEALAWSGEQDPHLLAVGYTHGWGQFVTFAFWQGVLADLEAAWLGQAAPNSYPLREVLVTYLQRVVYDAETLTALGGEVRNAAWEGQPDAALPISSRTLARRLAGLAGPQVVVVHRRLVRRLVRRQGRRRFRAGVDGTVLVVVGQDYEQVGEHFVPQAGRAQRGYQLYVLFLLDERVPVAFFIQEDVEAWEQDSPVEVEDLLDQLCLEGASLAQAAPCPADVLWRLVDESRQVLDVSHLGVVLCDRHFWRAQTMAEQARPGQEWFVTPATAYQQVKRALTSLPPGQWQRLGVNERCAETEVPFGRGRQQTRWRLVAFKRLGRVPRHDANGQLVRDEQGRVQTRWGVVYHSYLTNLSAEELSTPEVEGLYRGRWGIEHAFDELKNAYHLGRFPSTRFDMVRLHILLTLLLYTLVRAFQLWLVETQQATEALAWELSTLQRDWLRAPLAWLRWQQQRARYAKPKGWPRARRGRVASMLSAPP